MDFFYSYIAPNAVEFIDKVLSSGHISEGQVVKTFEKKFEEVFGLKNAVAVNSGTSALHLALVTLGVKFGDEVIIPPLTFVATGMAVMYCGATPVFCDIGKDGCIDYTKIEELITARTKAIIAVNWVGKSCNLYELESICQRHHLKLVIDAAQSLGCHVGGDIMCFSFQATKHLTTGDGGMLVCKNREDYEVAKRLRWFGIDKEKDLAGMRGERLYNLEQVGYKYHMNDYSAALGLANIETVLDNLDYHRKLATLYSMWLKDNFILYSNIDASSWWAYPINAGDVSSFSMYCRERTIPCSIIHRGIDHNKIFGGCDGSLKMMRWWENAVTHLPVHVGIEDGEVAWICEKVGEYV